MIFHTHKRSRFHFFHIFHKDSDYLIRLMIFREYGTLALRRQRSQVRILSGAPFSDFPDIQPDRRGFSRTNYH